MIELDTQTLTLLISIIPLLAGFLIGDWLRKKRLRKTGYS